MVSAGGSPRSYSAASSPKLFSGAASPTASQYDHIRMWSSSSQQSSVPNSPPRSHSTSGQYSLIVFPLFSISIIIIYIYIYMSHCLLIIQLAMRGLMGKSSLDKPGMLRLLYNCFTRGSS